MFLISLANTALLMCGVYLPIVYGKSDYTTKHQKNVITKLAVELIMDGKLKIKQTINIRNEHSRYLSFEVGYIIGQIREKYKLMMELYRTCYNRYYKPSKVLTPTPKIEEYRTIHFFQKHENILLLAMEIDKLVEVLERANVTVDPYLSIYEPPLPNLRARDDNSDSEQEQKLLEEAVKSRYREEYLMRKLNTTGQSTTKKRFINKWPVPGTWSLEVY